MEMSNPEHPEAAGAPTNENCIFCHIISGKVPSKEVYSDSKVKAVLDINPANAGHVLLMPKEHYLIFPQVPDELVGYLGVVSKAISKACIRALKVPATNIFIANGAAAGQKAQHVMMHVIPRKEGDTVQGFRLPHRQLPDEQYAKIAAVLKAQVEKALGKKSEEQSKSPHRPAPVTPPEPHAPAQLPPVAPPVRPTSSAEVDLDTITNLLGKPNVAEPKGASETQEALGPPFIASKHGGKFHLRNCPFIAKINRENRIELSSIEGAAKRELKPCECVKNAQL